MTPVLFQVIQNELYHYWHYTRKDLQQNKSSSWNNSDDKTIVASTYNWSNNDFEDFFKNSLERFKNDLFQIFTDFYYE
ncbi:18758_t:CDS:2, partial [Gigaspora margarita]